MQALLVDLYELTMGESYLAEGIDERPATFQLFCRTLPPGFGYLIAAGVEEALAFLAELRFGDEDLAYLETTCLFSEAFLERLAGLRFTGSVRAMREGTVFFPNEPVLEVTAPLLEAQLVETALVNVVHFQSLIAARAARCVEAAGGRRLVEFGLRRAHGADRGRRRWRGRASSPGFDATSDVLAGKRYGIPVAGTMAHSYVECFADETAAFEAFTASYPDGSTLLIDTYDTRRGCAACRAGRPAARRARRLARRGPPRLGRPARAEPARARGARRGGAAGGDDLRERESRRARDRARSRGGRADRRLRRRLAARRLGRARPTSTSSTSSSPSTAARC